MCERSPGVERECETQVRSVLKLVEVVVVVVVQGSWGGGAGQGPRGGERRDPLRSGTVWIFFSLFPDPRVAVRRKITQSGAQRREGRMRVL